MYGLFIYIIYYVIYIYIYILFIAHMKTDLYYTSMISDYMSYIIQYLFMSLTGWFVAPFLVAVSFVIPGLKAFNSTRRVPRSNQRFKDYTAVLRAVLLKLAQAVLEARISGGSREK